jgi:hypothetical protein
VKTCSILCYTADGYLEIHTYLIKEKIMRSVLLAAVLFFLLTSCRPTELIPPSPRAPTVTPSRTPAEFSPAAPTPSLESPEPDIPASIPAQTRLSPSELDHLFKTWMSATLFPLSPGPNLTLTEITPDEVWERLKAQIFVVSDPIFIYRPTFLVHQGSIMELGAGFDGLGMKPQDFVVADLSGDGQPELVYITTTDAEVMQVSRIVMVTWTDMGTQKLEADQTFRGRIELRKPDGGGVQVIGRKSGEQDFESYGELVLISDRRLTLAVEPAETASWVDYTSERFRISFQVPVTYTQVGEDQFQDEDGYILIEPYQGSAIAERDAWRPVPQGEINFSLVRACNLEVNAEPRLYGSDPTIRLVAFESPSERCLVSPGSDAEETGALILFRAPGGSMAALRTTPDMLEFVNQTLIFDLAMAPSYQIEARPFNQNQTVDLETAIQQLGELTLESYKLFPEDAHTPLDRVALQELITEPLAHRSEWRGTFYELPLSQQVEAATALIAPSGFHLEIQEPLDEGKLILYEGDTFVLQDLYLFSPPSAGSGPDGEPDFALVINIPEQPPGTFLVRKNDIIPFDMENRLWTLPVFVDEGLATLKISRKASGSHVVVKLDGEPVYTFITSYPNPLHANLMNWGGRWALLLDGIFIVDGHILNLDMEATEIFKPGVTNGKPFFFFIRDGLTYLSYGDKELDVNFDEVMHNVCCWGGGINPELNEDMVWFYARKDGWWYYVELGRY